MSWKTTPYGQAARWLRNSLLGPYHWSQSRREFTELLTEVYTPEDAINLLWRYQGHGVFRILRPNQNRYELRTLAERVRALNPGIIVEIGTRDGGTLFTWSQCADTIELLISIDLPGGIHGGGYPAKRANLYRLFTMNRPQCRLELLRLDSQQDSTRAQLVELLKGRPIDFLFIDADHRYAGVKKDYQLYADLVKPGGLIAFHDIRPNTKDLTIEVYRLWDEIKASGAPTEEIIHEPYEGRYGIGLLTQE